MTLGTYYELAAERGDDGLERWMDGWMDGSSSMHGCRKARPR